MDKPIKNIVTCTKCEIIFNGEVVQKFQFSFKRESGHFPINVESVDKTLFKVGEDYELLVVPIDGTK